MQAEPQSRAPQGKAVHLGAKEVELTHTDRLYFPEAGITKGHLLAYHAEVAPYFIPHIKDRPLTLERWPEGVDDGHFFQKDAGPSFPPWLRTFPLERKDHEKTVHYPLVEDAADLLFLVNLGTMTFHAFLSRITDLQHPDIVVVDIDPPDEPTRSPHPRPVTSPFGQAVEAAFLLRDELAAAGYAPLVKTSGKRGLHLAFRFPGRLEYGQARAALQDLFARAVKRQPALLTLEFRKEKRRGRVYLDAFRMSLGATIVPPYVVRATSMATVSAPVTWEELETLPGAETFTVTSMSQRLHQIGDLWAPLLPEEDPEM